MKTNIVLLILISLFGITNLIAQECPIPPKTEWKNPYEKCEQVPGTYEIQFFSTRLECFQTITWDYEIRFDSCTELNRYYLKTKTPMNYCDVLLTLIEIQKDFPDAFPKRVYEEKTSQKVFKEVPNKPKDPIAFTYTAQVLILDATHNNNFKDPFWSNILNGDQLELEIHTSHI